MKYLLNWVAEYLPQPCPDKNQVIDALEKCGLTVAGVQETKLNFNGVVVGQVLEVGNHPNADRLKLTKVSDGSSQFQVVCGAPNVAAHQKIAFARPGAKLTALEPPLVIQSRKIRNVQSDGMICSSFELGLNTDQNGILVLPEDWTLGKNLDEYIRPETILDVELPFHRWDLASHLGLARELAVFLWRSTTKNPEAALLKSKGDLPVSIDAAAASVCRRYEGTLLSGIKVGKSPWWMARRLELLGMKSINNVVDATNYILLETGQPLHAFDWNLVRGKKLSVRYAKAGEQLKALDSREYQLQSRDLVISDTAGPVALAGVIGGESTKVTDATNEVFLECAWFTRGAVRETARRHSLRTESSARFEKETDIEGLPLALARAAQLINSVSGGALEMAGSLYPNPQSPAPINFSVACLESILGFPVKGEELSTLLSPLGEGISRLEDQRWSLIPKSYRSDLRRQEDLAEETLRYLGFSRVPGRQRRSSRISLPEGLSQPTANHRARCSKTFLDAFQAAGFYEAINFSLGSAQQMSELYGEAILAQSLALTNPVSSELEWLRPSLLQGLYSNWQHNRHHGQKRIFLQETGYAFRRQNLPGHPHRQSLFWAAIAYGEKTPPSWNQKEPPEFGFWDIMGLVEKTLTILKAPAERAPVEHPYESYHPHWQISFKVEGKPLGSVAVIATKESLDNAHGRPLAYAEIDLDALAAYLSKIEPARYRPLPAIEPIERDLAVVVDQSTSWAQIAESSRRTLGPLLKDIYPFDLYVSKKLGAGKKSIAFRLVFQPQEKTPTAEEINQWLSTALAGLEKGLGAQLRS